MTDNKYDRVETLDNIESEGYHHFPGTFSVVCCVKMRNGWSEIGTSSCFSAHKFDLQRGKEHAFNMAMSNIRRMESYANAREKLLRNEGRV